MIGAVATIDRPPGGPESNVVQSLSLLALAFLLPICLIAVNLIFFKKHPRPREKLSPFECGFDAKSLPRTPFSLKFYLIAILFLIFDVELALILPAPVIISSITSANTHYLLAIFIIVLFLGLLFE